MQYADVLGYSLCEIFDEQSLEDLVEPLSEDKLLEQVETAIRQLQTRGIPIRLGSIGDLVGMTVRGLKRYPRVKKLLSRCERERRQELFQVDPQREEELVKQIEQTLKQVEARGEPIVLQHICDLVGLSYSYMVMRYPRIRALFSEYQKNRSERGLSPRLDEEAKVQQVQTAIDVLVSQGRIYYTEANSPDRKADAKTIEKLPSHQSAPCSIHREMAGRGFLKKTLFAFPLESCTLFALPSE